MCIKNAWYPGFQLPKMTRTDCPSQRESSNAHLPNPSKVHYSGFLIYDGSFPSLHPHPSSMFEETCDVNTSSGLPGIEELFHQLGSQANSLPGSIWLNDTSNRNSFYINICIQLYIYILWYYSKDIWYFYYDSTDMF